MLVVYRGISLKVKLSNNLLMAILQAVLAVCMGISLKVKLSNNLLVAVLQAMLAVCRGDKNVRNPKYLTGAKREIYEFMEDFLPSTQYYQVLQWSIERPVRFILCDVGILVVMTGAGVAAFRRKDLK